MNTNTNLVPVTGEPAPLEVREAVHQLSRRFPNGVVVASPPTQNQRWWLVAALVSGVTVSHERVYPGFAAAVEAERDGVTDSVYLPDDDPRLDTHGPWPDETRAPKDDLYTTVRSLLEGGVDEVDTASSVSRQHFIDTGRYLTVEEARDEAAYASVDRAEQAWVADYLAQQDSPPAPSSLYEAEGEPRIDSQWDERD